MSYVTLGRLASRRVPSALRRFNAAAQRRSLSVYGSSSAGDEPGEGGGKRAQLPLNAEWAELARKQLKGADPAEALTWKTPEVSTCTGGVVVCEGVIELKGQANA